MLIKIILIVCMILLVKLLSLIKERVRSVKDYNEAVRYVSTAKEAVHVIIKSTNPNACLDGSFNYDVFEVWYRVAICKGFALDVELWSSDWMGIDRARSLERKVKSDIENTKENSCLE